MHREQEFPEDFTPLEGGPFYEAMVKMRLNNKQGKLAVAGLCIAWLPLAIITAIEGTFYSGTQKPFLQDFAMHSRLLVALPMLIMIKPVINAKVAAVANYLSKVLISPEEKQLILTTTFRRAKKITSSAITEIILLLVVIATSISFIRGGVYSALESDTTSWMTSTKEGIQKLSVAGYWAVIISIPLFQLLFLRWLLRYFVWMMLLFRVSRAKLNLLPTHPDRAGGLGIIMVAQRSFNLIFVASSVAISGELIVQLMERPDSFNTMRSQVIAYVIICIIVLLIPLLFFTGKLLKTKNEGVLHLSNFGTTLSHRFERGWITDFSIEKTMNEPEADPSMVYDYGGIYDSVQQLRIVPVTMRAIVGMAIILLAPFIPLLFIHFSVAELLQKVAGMLL